MSAPALDFVWQDREIVFDAKPQMLECRRGEVTIDSINSVEDTKGLQLYPFVSYANLILCKETTEKEVHW